MPILKQHNIAVIVPAAGRGARMAGDTHKLLLPSGTGKPVVRAAVEAALAWQPSEAVVVVGACAEQIGAALDGLEVRLVYNERYAEGMGTSLAVGIEALGDKVTSVLVLLGDQPLVSAHIVARLLNFYLLEGKPITMPSYGSQPGPPTLFGCEAFTELKQLTGDEGGRQLAKRRPEWLTTVQFDADEMPPDVDTQDDYRTLFRND